jgi:raffinose/stachyose/melibiose transport system permease protein
MSKSINNSTVVGMKVKKHYALEVLAILLLVIFLFPFFLVVINSAKDSASIIISPLSMPTNWSQLLSNLNNAINNKNFAFWNSFFSSIIITAVSLLAITIFSAMAAWVLVRSKTKLSAIIFLVFVAAMVIPFQVVMLPLVSTFRKITQFTGIKMINSYTGLIFAYLGFGGSLSLFVFHGFIKNIPYELEEAAIIDSCGLGRIFFVVIFPLLKPVQMTVMILNGVWIWNDFLLPSLLLGLSGKVKTLPIAVQSFAGSYVKQWDLILSCALLAMIPIIVLFLFAQKQIIKGVVDGAIK